MILPVALKIKPLLVSKYSTIQPVNKGLDMAWQFSFHVQQLCALRVFGASLGTLITVPALALSFGETIVHSAQYEPLLASIDVSEVDSANFSATLAKSSIYQKMGLSQTKTLTATFVPNSAHSGTIVIQTKAPLPLPFADVVLALQHQNQQTLMPKTLLLPLQGRVKLPDDLTVLSSNKPLTPLSLDLTENLSSKPLLVRNEAPPPLFDTPKRNHNFLLNHDQLQDNVLAQNHLPTKNQPKPLMVLSAEFMPELTPKPSQDLMAKTLQIKVTQRHEPLLKKPLNNVLAEQDQPEGEVLVSGNPKPNNIDNPSVELKSLTVTEERLIRSPVNRSVITDDKPVATANYLATALDGKSKDVMAVTLGTTETESKLTSLNKNLYYKNTAKPATIINALDDST